MSEKTLHLNFHGRVIDHLGIQMYQSPTAAIAEIISNSWDADAENVDVTFDFTSEIRSHWKIIIKDDGWGMTFDDCQNRFLTVGFDRRDGEPAKKSQDKQRPPMGRKGIGKFAGFGIAKNISIRTISGITGELTCFDLDIDTIRQGDTYVSKDPLEIVPKEYLPPDNTRKSQKGTTIILSCLEIIRRISEDQFRMSMARRFVVQHYASDFSIRVGGEPLPMDEDLSEIELAYPRDYSVEKKPKNLIINDKGWGIEELPNGNRIKWRILFFNNTVKEEDLKGISVFAHGKLAQRPFMFNLTGGLTSQTGPEYMSGAVIADFVDELQRDVISTERQRLNWEADELSELERWGQARIKSLLGLWKESRAEEKRKFLEEKVGAFRTRLDKLGIEGKTVEGALKKLSQIEKLTKEQFKDIGHAILTAWESGRLRALINEVANTHEMDEVQLLRILVEANTIQALHTAESVRAKLDTISGLEQRIKVRDLENAVRDFIAHNPWLIAPQWETFAIEKGLSGVVADATKDAKLDKDEAYTGRVDLVLSSGNQLLLLEFMRPGLKIDSDHINRFEEYVNTIKATLDVSTATQFKHIVGYLIADDIIKSKPAIVLKIKKLKDQEMVVSTWRDLLEQAKRQWREFLDHIVERSPADDRLQALVGELTPEE